MCLKGNNEGKKGEQEREGRGRRGALCVLVNIHRLYAACFALRAHLNIASSGWTGICETCGIALGGDDDALPAAAAPLATTVGVG